MLNVEELMKDLKPYVEYMARRYYAYGHAILSQEDMIAEGWYMFSKILVLKSDLNEHSFKKWFKTSLFNHMKSLIDTYRYSDKKGYSKKEGILHDEFFIDLSEIEEKVGEEWMFDVYYTEYVQQVKAILSVKPDAVILFEQLLEPSGEVCDVAIHESMRRACLRRQGHCVRNVDVVRVKIRHIQEYLEWPNIRFQEAMQDVKMVVGKYFGRDAKGILQSNINKTQLVQMEP